MRVSAGGSFAGQARSPLRVQTPPLGIARRTVSATGKLWRQRHWGHRRTPGSRLSGSRWMSIKAQNIC